MSSTIIEREKRKAIIQNTYRCFRVKEREGKTRSATIADIVNDQKGVKGKCWLEK